MSADFQERDTCRVCGAKELKLILDLGTMPLANAFLTKEALHAPEHAFPLRLFYCPACSLVQLVDVVDSKILFTDYDYLTSASPPLAQHFRDMGEEMIRQFDLRPDDLVVEVGSNDGVLLGQIRDRVRVLGIDPSRDAAEIAKERYGVETIVSFLDDTTVETVLREHAPARLVIANNVMAHIDDIVATFERVRRLLAPGGVFIFEVHWVGNLIGEGGFDQIYHEHLCYFSLHALQHLIKRAGLHLVDAEFVPIHGTSLRVYAANAEAGLSERARDILKMEEERALQHYSAYADFAERVHTLKKKLVDLLKELRTAGKRIIGYGAPAKGNTLLNYCGIGTDTIEYIVDSTPLKQGRYSPGAHIPIRSPEVLLTDTPDYVLLLAWNFKDFILKKEQALRDRGATFVVAIPDVEVL